ncbi:MAG: hypothetical protein M0Q38_02155 [Bacteroidales bacterium]|jgi:hypothetical protein|nr:hypothetical protein [Bacteroidales bacterium]
MKKKQDMSVTTLDLYNILRSKIGEVEAKTLVEYVEQKITLQVEGEVSGLATKADIMATKADLMNEVAKLEVKIEKTKSEIIKWMFIFWAGQTGIMVGILALFLK